MKIAGLTVLKDIENFKAEELAERMLKVIRMKFLKFLNGENSRFTTEQIEEAMQTSYGLLCKVVLKQNYRFNEKQLKIADEKIKQLYSLSENLVASDFRNLCIYMS